MSRYENVSFTLSFFFFFQLVFSQLPSKQIATMTNLYEMLQNNSGNSSFRWSNAKKDSNPCSWVGVSCSSSNSSVTELSLPLFSISSSEILPVICQIDSLESLDISNNHLSSIPYVFISSCGGISGLKLLNISRNELGGSLPTFNGFQKLEVLDLSRNSLMGNINLQFDGLDSLKSLNLSYNNFTGPLPINLGKNNLLQELQLSTNGFQGEIPVGLVKYGNLSLIDLSHNELSGLIPERFGELSKLQILVLSGSNLRGEIPKLLVKIQTLFRFAANQNNFVGNIPPGITTYLRNLDLSFNKLSGTIPQDLLSPRNLLSVDLSSNLLEGPIPTEISLSLFRLRLGGNLLNGTVSFRSYGSLTKLTYLELDNNSLTGEIPPELGLCRSLALLNLAQNRLTGVLPVQLGNLANLQVLYLQKNKLVGVIPHQFTQLHSLQRMNFSSNSIGGSIPASISKLQNLTNLDLRHNNLSGPIPISIRTLNLLLELQLGNNQLSGDVPAMPSSLQIALNLSNNFFGGPIPVSLSGLIALEVLDLSNNNFSGGNKGLNQAPSNAPPASSKKKRTVSVGVVIGAAVAAALAAGLLTLIVISISRRYYRVNDMHLQSEEAASEQQVILGNLLTANGIHRSNIDFMKAMEAVANNSNIILKTKFSTYYKTVMPSGANYLVKKLTWSDKIFQLGNHERFGEELEVIGKLSNSNVMIPLAYVLTVDSAHLFYDFAPKGTLFDHLHGNSESALHWASRYSIAIGVAQGLTFLHGCPSGSILLLDLSSKSILLKSLNEPQIGDIELCKVIDPSKSTGSLSTVAGSVGYIPPEYAYTMRVTMPGNVYSFGVLLLELLTGKPAVNQGTELAKWVLSNSAQQNKWDNILDFSVIKTSLAVRSQMLAVLKVALACVSASPEGRPKMKSVLRMLLNAR
ncbi:leucine-rich repeat receptor-like protein kinase TDR isoform X2 [Coffea eugenioides]|uniref:leucine-rich repeat receptor-like protein kinase TDR isoform X2 n=1 Tax=Coffea eugenioides TaxID=49369 RepID=UPI000F60DC2D|nr:leucine-rich repeat receptor-like protein kinase TDR isoform X2 [Coffea eugenioides]